MPHRTSAPFERVRVPAARWLFHRRPFIRAALSLTPDSHPFKPFAASTLDDVDEFAEVALRPRINGEIIPVVKTPPKQHRRRASAGCLAACLAALFLADAIQASPIEFGLSESLGMHVYSGVEKPCTIDLLPACNHLVSGP